MAGHPVKQGATRPYRQHQTREGNRKAKSRKLASPRLASPLTTLALLSRTPNHQHCCGWLLHHLFLFFCFFFFFPCVALRFEHPAADRALHTGIPRSLPLRSALFQLNLVPKTQTRRPKQGYRGELRVRTVGADRTM